MQYLKYFAIILLFLPFVSFGQKTVASQQTPGGKYEDIVRKREFSIGLKMHTSGFGLSTNFVKINSIYKKTVYEFEIMNLKHPKEHKQQSLFSTGRRGFIFGKKNDFFNLNASLGQVKTLAEKGRKSGVSVSLYYAAGPSLGITKPYYLTLIYNTPGGGADPRNEKYSEENAAFFLNNNIIVSAAGFTHGLNEIGIKPGAQAKFAFLFDWANYDEFVKGLEVGGMVNGYLGDVPIMVNDGETGTDNKFFFVNFYVRLLLGKRW